ncbi:MAG: hypothetical protein KGL39_31655 [Patescibacteria group bacterium]|nr:hypothetical protein [Patescibacteria group bacterium]
MTWPLFLSSSTPAASGVGAAGSSAVASPSDHAHPQSISLASAATLSLASCASVVTITGTTTMTDISNPPAADTQVTFIFASASCGVTSGNHWKLLNSQNFTSVAGGTLTGTFDASGNFNETYRSPGQGGTAYLAFQNSADASKKFQRVASGSMTSSGGVGSIFQSGATLSWPSTFGTTPVVQATAVGNSASWGGAARLISTTSVTVDLFGAANTSTGTIEAWGLG